jgi:hypothetical protein
MWKERAKAQAAAFLENSLACFEVDQQGTELSRKSKMIIVTFDPLPTTSSSKVKPDETPAKFSITCD